jgi:hypothetical protein
MNIYVTILEDRTILSSPYITYNAMPSYHQNDHSFDGYELSHAQLRVCEMATD